MGDLASILYKQFFLRDFLGMICPGAVLVAGFFCSTEPTQEILICFLNSPSVDHVILIPFYLACLWLLGVSIQCVGKRLLLLSSFPIPRDFGICSAWKHESQLVKRVWSVFLAVLKTIIKLFYWIDADIHERLFQKRLVVFTTDPKITDFNRQQRERHVVIKDACGNMAVALFVVSINMLFVVCYWSHGIFPAVSIQDLLFFLIRILLISFFATILLLEHRKQRKLQADYENTVIQFVKSSRTTFE